jgi:hypothetical protein
MRRIDKIKNLKKANLLSEERYLDTKYILDEGWKSAAAGIGMALGSLSCANAQTAQPKDTTQQQVIQTTKDVCSLVSDGGFDLGAKLIRLYKMYPQAFATLEKDPNYKHMTNVIKKWSQDVDKEQGMRYYDAQIADYVNIPQELETRLGDRFMGRDMTKNFIIAMENNAQSR